MLTMPVTTLTYEEWVERFKPIQIHDENDDSYNGCLCDPWNGTDRALVDKMVGTNTVWTLIEEDGIRSIIEGWHYVNREGYFVTEIPYSGSETFEVTFGDEQDDEDEYAEE